MPRHRPPPAKRRSTPRPDSLRARVLYGCLALFLGLVSAIVLSRNSGPSPLHEPTLSSSLSRLSAAEVGEGGSAHAEPGEGPATSPAPMAIAGAASPPRPPVYPPPGVVASATPESSRPDVFGPLREASAPTREAEPEWGKLAADLRRLKSLEGAGVDGETGQIILAGEVSTEPGPFFMEDFLVALRAAFFELERPGMTFDEDPNDKEGPTMHVRYFGGTSNTHFGLVMFEVDRLMKCFGQGVDNLTRETLRPQFPGFRTQIDISREEQSERKEPTWSRFWANLATGRFPTNDLRGKVVVEPSPDRRTIAFLEHRVWIDTERMYDPGPGRRLMSSGGVRDPSAERFADLLTAEYDRIAVEFPVFRDLHELSKLVVLAEWLRESDAPFDPELLYCRIDSPTKTPPTTPSLRTTNSWEEGSFVRSIVMLGGVNLDGTPHYGTPIDPTKKKVDALADAVLGHRPELRRGETVQTSVPDGAPRGLIPLGPHVRGPPGSPSAPAPREPTRVMEVGGRYQPVSRELDDPVLGRHELPLRTHQATGQDMLDLPILRTYFSPRHQNTVTFTGGPGGSVSVPIPDRVYLTSPSRDISIQFSNQPEFDAVLGEAFFPTRAAGIKGYYPKSRRVRLADGTEYRFNEAGLPDGVSGPNRGTLTIEHTAYRDGPCVLAPDTTSTLPRGPPREPTLLVEARRRSPVISRELDAPTPEFKIRTAGLIEQFAPPDVPPIAIDRAVPLRTPSVPSSERPATMPRAPPAESVRILESRVRPPVASRELGEPGPGTPTRAILRNADTGRSWEVRDEGGRLFFVLR